MGLERGGLVEYTWVRGGEGGGVGSVQGEQGGPGK